MESKTLTIPTLYGDHHATAVKKILDEMEGVKSVFIATAFRQVHVEFDPKKVKAAEIETALADHGYSEDAPELAYPQAIGDRKTRHTAAYSGTGNTLSFGEAPPTFEGRPLWPCPGFKPTTMDE
jgi:copper chaperone CopZ